MKKIKILPPSILLQVYIMDEFFLTIPIKLTKKKKKTKKFMNCISWFQNTINLVQFFFEGIRLAGPRLTHLISLSKHQIQLAYGSKREKVFNFSLPQKESLQL